ncbi:MAG: hypothetical protein AAF548_13485 [Actinomycetota bacterium]
MRRVRLFACAAVLATACSGIGATSWEDSLDDALERQPAGLVDRPDSFLIGDGQPDSCGGPHVSWLLAIEIATGERAWETQVPHTYDAPIVGPGVVMNAGTELDTMPPSVVGIDIETGEPRWQRFFADHYLYDTRSVGDGISFFGVDDEYVVGFDGSLLAQETKAPERGIGEEPIDTGWSASFADDRLTVDGPDETTVLTEALQVPDGFDTVRRAEEANGRLLVEIGSSIGPNAHAVVVSLDGELLHSESNVRNARLIGDRLLYDVRNTNMAREGQPTRELIARAMPGGELLWQTQAFAEYVDGLPGLVGGLGGDPVFAVHAGTGVVDLVRVVEPGDIPDVIDPGVRRFRERLRVLTDDLIAVGTDDGIAVLREQGDAAWIPTTLGVQSVARADDRLIAVTGTPPGGCD